jgi:hypothetical protein
MFTARINSRFRPVVPIGRFRVGRFIALRWVWEAHRSRAEAGLSGRRCSIWDSAFSIVDKGAREVEAVDGA